MLFGGDSGHRLEPVGEMRRTLFDRPILHRVGDHVRDIAIELAPALNRAAKRLVILVGQAVLHDGIVKHHAAEHFLDFAHVLHPFGRFLLL